MFCQRPSDCTNGVFPKRTAIRNTETQGLFTFIVGGSQLDNIDEITASQNSVRAFLRDQTSNRSDIKFGEVICYSAYRYVENMLRELDEIKRCVIQN